MKLRRPFLLCFLGILFLASPLSAQNSDLETGVFLGGSTYRGDVVKPDVFTLKDTKLAYGVYTRYALSPQWRLRAGLTMSKLGAGDHNYETDWKEKRSFQFFYFFSGTFRYRRMASFWIKFL